MANNKNTKVPNVPNLRFPEFQGEWEKYELGDICDIITDFVAAGSFASLRENVKYYQENNYAQLIRTIDLKNNFTNSDFVYVDEVAYDFLWRVQLKEPNIVLPNIGANIGEKYYVKPQDLPKNKNVLGPNAILLRSKCNDTHFVYFRLSTSSYDNEMKKLVGASGQPKFNKTDLKKVSLFMPSLIEQKRIAYFLALLEERIATQNKIIERYESLIRGLNNTLQYDTGGKSVCLGDILLERSERSRTNNQHEVLSSTVKGIFSQREYFSKDIASENNVGYKIIRLHDVVLSPQNLWMGNINYNEIFEIGIVSPSYKVFSIADGYDNQFVAAMLKTHRALYSYMMVSEQGASIVRRNLNMEAFSQLVFKIPSLDKQREIGYAISLLKSQLKTANKLIKAYTSQKQYLLRQMFI